MIIILNKVKEGRWLKDIFFSNREGERFSPRAERKLREIARDDIINDPWVVGQLSINLYKFNKQKKLDVVKRFVLFVTFMSIRHICRIFVFLILRSYEAF